jgi:hypothetical protein
LLLHPYTSAKADKSTLHKVIIARWWEHNLR